MRLVVLLGAERVEQRGDDGLHPTFERLQHDVAGEAVGHADVDVGAHHVAALDVADEVEAGRGGQQLVRLLAEGVALARLLTDRQQADPRLGDAEAVTGVHGTHQRELDEPLGLHLGVGTGVEQDRRGRAGDRDRRGDRRALDAGDAAHAQQRRRHRRTRVAGGDHRARPAVANRLGGTHERGVLLAPHALRGVVVHADDLGRLDQVELEAGGSIDAIEIGRPDEDDRRAGLAAQEAPATIGPGAASPPMASTAIGSM